MATVRRNFYYYQLESSETSFLTKLRQTMRLNNPQRGEYTQNGQQFLYECRDENGVWTGYTTILREELNPELGKRNSSTGSPIDMQGNDGILERSHFIYSPVLSILMFEYNPVGPRATAFFRAVDYTYKKHVDSDSVDTPWSYAPRGNALQRIENGQSIISVDFSTHPIHFGASAPQGSRIGNLVEDTRQVGNPARTKITLQGTKKFPLMTRVRDFRDKFLRNNTIGDYEKLEVKVLNNQGYIDTIDVVKDQVKSSISLLKLSGSKTVETEAAYNAMLEDMRAHYGDSI